MENSNERRGSGRTNIFPRPCFLVALRENVKLAKILRIVTGVCSNQGFLPVLKKNYQKQKRRGNLMPKRCLHGSYDMGGHAKKCAARYCELANKTTQHLHTVATQCLDDHQFREEENGSVGELSTVCSHIVLKCLHLARIGRPDVLWVCEQACSCCHKMDKIL